MKTLKCTAIVSVFNSTNNNNNNTNNKPDNIILHNKQGTCVLIHVAIPADRNVIKTEAENILKRKKAMVLPVIGHDGPGGE